MNLDEKLSVLEAACKLDASLPFEEQQGAICSSEALALITALKAYRDEAASWAESESGQHGWEIWQKKWDAVDEELSKALE